MYRVFFITQDTLVIDDTVYAAEYENVTGVSNTYVKCYETRHFIFTDSKYSFIIDCGIVLDGKPDLHSDTYTIINDSSY